MEGTFGSSWILVGGTHAMSWSLNLFSFPEQASHQRKVVVNRFV
jgi:hypothetical protein